MKLCSRCNVLKNEIEFHKDKQKKDGLRPNCKDCKSIIDKQWRENNKEKKKEIDKAYYNKNCEKIKKKNQKIGMNAIKKKQLILRMIGINLTKIKLKNIKKNKKII
jgi:hypothetical protein